MIIFFNTRVVSEERKRSEIPQHTLGSDQSNVRITTKQRMIM
jgi:hypothetical protein